MPDHGGLTNKEGLMASYLKISVFFAIISLFGVTVSAQGRKPDPFDFEQILLELDRKAVVVGDQELKLPPSATDLATELPESEAPVAPKAEIEKASAPAEPIVPEPKPVVEKTERAESRADSPRRKKGKKVKVTPAETMKVKASLASRLDEIETEIADLKAGNEALEAEMKDLEVVKPSLDVKQALNLARIKVLEGETKSTFKELKRISSKEERKKLDKMRDKRDAENKLANGQANVAKSAQLRCSPEFEGLTKVNPGAVSRSRRIEDTVFVRVHHAIGGELFDIGIDDGRWIVTDFCPGGDMTISISRHWLFDNGRLKVVTLTAKTKSGRIAQPLTITFQPQFYGFGYGYANIYEPRERGLNWIPFPSASQTGSVNARTLGGAGVSRRSVASASDCQNFPAWFKC